MMRYNKRSDQQCTPAQDCTAGKPAIKLNEPSIHRLPKLPLNTCKKVHARTDGVQWRHFAGLDNRDLLLSFAPLSMTQVSHMTGALTMRGLVEIRASIKSSTSLQFHRSTRNQAPDHAYISARVFLQSLILKSGLPVEPSTRSRALACLPGATITWSYRTHICRLHGSLLAASPSPDPGHLKSAFPDCICFVDMCTSVGMKLVVAILVVALCSVPSAWSIAVPSAWSSDGHITFYGSANGQGTQGGACAYQNTFALGYGTMTAALSTPLFLGGAGCGACYEIKCKLIKETNTAKNWCYSYSRSIIITATNLCPPGSEGTWCDPPRRHFDLPMPAFLTLAKQQGGVAPVYYRRVPCSRKGGIRYTVGGNAWFFMILIHNVAGAGDVVSAKVKCPSSKWLPMYRNWGALWTVQYQLKGAMSFQLTLGNGVVVTTNNAVGTGWKFGQTWEADTNAK